MAFECVSSILQWFSNAQRPVYLASGLFFAVLPYLLQNSISSDWRSNMFQRLKATVVVGLSSVIFLHWSTGNPKADT